MNASLSRLWLVLLLLLTSVVAQGQLTPSQDAYTDTAHPTINYGTAATLGVANGNTSIQTSYVQFDLSAIPSGYSGNNIAKATLKVYVDGVTKAGSFNIDYVNGAWSESTITANLAPVLGSTIAASVPLATSDKNDYISVDITTALQAWLNGSQANDGIAIVANSPLACTIDSTKNTKTSHSPELDVVFASGQGTITGVLTGSGSGLMGGGTSGTLNLSLTNACSSGQVLSWSGSAWVCTTVKGTGTVTSVGSGLGLKGGPITTSGTLSIDTTAVPLLSSFNTFTVVQAISSSASNTDGLDVLASGPGHAAVVGINTATSGVSDGVLGASESASGYGVYGSNSASGGTGVYGTTSGGYAVYGNDSGGGFGVIGTGLIGVYGLNLSGGFGVIGSSASGHGLDGSGQWGVYAQSSACCSGSGGSFFGYTAPSGSGNSGTNGITAIGGNGDSSSLSGGGVGAQATGGNGLLQGGEGVFGTGGTGAIAGTGGFFSGGNSSSTKGPGGDGVYGQGGSGTGGDPNGYAGNFNGNLNVTGAITAGTKDFKIDHPLDPANKYLVHASVESSEMMNIYTGNITTDTQGLATVQLPEWFETLNTDFRYQLTVIGTFAQAIVSREIQNHQFSIKTNAPNVKVSWQVTGVRQDAYAKAHPLVVEQEKDATTKGFYIHPDLYGAPQEKQIEWVRHPEMMQRLKEQGESPRPVAAPIVLRAPKPASSLPLAVQRALKKR
jgi:hypothetical protein